LYQFFVLSELDRWAAQRKRCNSCLLYDSPTSKTKFK